MKLAVLGAGSIGTRHAHNASALGHAVIVFDPNPKARQVAADRGLATTATRAAAIDFADAVVIASPNGQHKDDLDACIHANRHVLVEKPLATSICGLGNSLAQGRAKGLHLFVAQNLRVHPAVIYARELLTAQTLGQLLWARLVAASYLPAWRPGTDHRMNYTADPRTGGAIFDYVHELDLAWYLFGPYSVQACVARTTGTIGIAAEDTADLLLGHQSGLISNVHVDYVTVNPERITAIAGTKGRLEIDILGRCAKLFGTESRITAAPRFHGVHSDDYVIEMKHFIQAIQGAKTTILCDADEGLAVLQQVLRARGLAGLPGGLTTTR